MALSHSPKIVTDGLVLCLDAGDRKSYSGSGTTWYDRSGNGNNGTLVNGAFNSEGYWDSVTNTGSQYNQDQLVFTVSHSTSLNDAFTTTTKGWSIEEIVKINDVTYPEAAAGTVVSSNAYSANSVGFDWNHGINNNSFQMGLKSTGSSSGYEISLVHSLPTKFKTLGQWLHRSLFWNRANGTMGLYYNGEHIVTHDISTASGRTIYDGGGITFGSLYGWHHDGSRASIKVYNKVLTNVEVLQNYNATKGRFS
jgi:hypothetical protein